jgi:hypothetical protein
MTTAKEVFSRPPPSGFDERLTGVSGAIRFDVRNVGTWRLEIADGRYVIDDHQEPANLVLTLDEKDLVAVAERKQYFLTSVMRGDIQAKGELALLLKLNAFVTGPPRYT